MVRNGSLASYGLSASLVKGLVGEEARIPPPEIRFWLLCIPWTAAAMVLGVLAVPIMNVTNLSFPMALKCKSGSYWI